MTRRVEEDLVILDVTSGHYFALDGAGALIWDLLEHEVTRDDLVSAVVTAFDVDREEAAVDIDELITELADRGLVDR